MRILSNQRLCPLHYFLFVPLIEAEHQCSSKGIWLLSTISGVFTKELTLDYTWKKKSIWLDIPSYMILFGPIKLICIFSKREVQKKKKEITEIYHSCWFPKPKKEHNFNCKLLQKKWWQQFVFNRPERMTNKTEGVPDENCSLSNIIGCNLMNLCYEHLQPAFKDECCSETVLACSFVEDGSRSLVGCWLLSIPTCSMFHALIFSTNMPKFTAFVTKVVSCELLLFIINLSRHICMLVILC